MSDEPVERVIQRIQELALQSLETDPVDRVEAFSIDGNDQIGVSLWRGGTYIAFHVRQDIDQAMMDRYLQAARNAFSVGSAFERTEA